MYVRIYYQNGDVEAVEWLMENGADDKLKNKDGQLPHECPVEEMRQDAMEEVVTVCRIKRRRLARLGPAPKAAAADRPPERPVVDPYMSPKAAAKASLTQLTRAQQKQNKNKTKQKQNKCLLLHPRGDCGDTDAKSSTSSSPKSNTARPSPKSDAAGKGTSICICRRD